jgi:hypothetical protein
MMDMEHGVITECAMESPVWDEPFFTLKYAKA